MTPIPLIYHNTNYYIIFSLWILYPVDVLKIPDLAPSLHISSHSLEGGSAVKLWLKKVGLNSQIQQGCHPKWSAGWCKALPSLRIPAATSSWKDVLFSDTSLLWSRSDDISLSLTGSALHTVKAPEWSSIKTQFAANSWLLKVKAG